MESVVEGVVRFAGWSLLKVITFGKYRSDDREGMLLEGGLGLLVIAGLAWAAYRFAAP